MKKLLAVLIFLNTPVYAGLITHTDYTSGNTITAAGQNANENAVFNEFNGNIDNTNIKTGGIQDANIAASIITSDKFASTVISTFNYVFTFGVYRRPAIQYANSTTVDVEANTGVLNQTCIQFPDAQRCVTEDTASTDKYRRFIITSTATFLSGTEDSGMSGQWGSNQWIALYAVKSQINTSNFIVAGTTNAATQGNYATLNTMFGTNGWVFLGRIRVGDNVSSGTSILSFYQSGSIFRLRNSAAGNEATSLGIRLATTAGATSLTYTASSGSGATDLPTGTSQITFIALCHSGSGTTTVADQTGGAVFAQTIGTGRYGGFFPVTGDIGLKISNGSSSAMDIFLYEWIEPVLTSGYNPQL